jgi:hypothetical protein
VGALEIGVRDAPGVLIARWYLDHDPGLVSCHKSSFEATLAVVTRSGAQADGDVAADEAREVVRTPQPALDTRARHLELVTASRHRIRLVENVRDGRCGLADGAQVEAGIPVDRDLQVPGRRLDVNKFNPEGGEHGRDQLLYGLGRCHRGSSFPVLVADSTPDKTKTWATAHVHQQHSHPNGRGRS